MKFANRPKWKRILLAVVCLIGVLGAVRGSYAAYTSQAFLRGVVRNQDNEKVRFSSNYLELYAKSSAENVYVEKKISVADSVTEGQKYNIEITVCNYVNGNTNLFSQNDITYNMTIKASGEGAAGCKVKYNAEEKNITETGITFESQTLTGRNAFSHTYVIEVPAEAVDKVKITVKAEPDTNSSAVTKNQLLAGVLVPCTGDATSTFHYEGKFTDADAGYLPEEYHGFNYQISITGSAAMATLSWNADILEIDKYFLQKKGLTAQSVENRKGWETVSFEMNQLNGSGDYLIPFYIKNKTDLKDYTWNDMDKLIEFEAIPQESE